MYSSTKDDTVQNLKTSAQNVKAAATETFGEVKDDLCATANNAGRKVRGFMHSAGEEFSHATDVVSTQIKDKPIQSSLIALGVGFVLGVLFRR